MIFPIGFDLEKGVENAGKDWNSKYADRLEKLIAKRPVNVKLKLDLSEIGDLSAKITKELKAATAAEKRAKAELTTAKAIEQREKKESNIAIVQANRTKAEENATAATKRREIAEANLLAAQKRRAITENNLVASAARMEKAQLSLANAKNGTARATQNLNREYKNQDGYISRIIKRLAVYAGLRQITNFLTQVKEVTAQFELQRVSLGAIIQDQTRANALFSEIKSFALKSPVSILDLTKYTKQLAAYKIGVDELFETTKKLTDVSVGLGVSMDRVVLAYGQTRATGYLRASEIRQFTEMGVPIVEELAAKLSKMNGELVTAAQVMDMVSKRAISFDLVKEVFDDMTAAGGIFYNMQEKQGNTLFGMWAKLGDAASVMYNEIGNTETVNSVMKDSIQLLTDLMRNWQNIARIIKFAALSFGAFKVSSMILKALQVNTVAATAATRQFTRATFTHKEALKSGNVVVAAYSNMLRRLAIWNKKAALSTNIMTVAVNKLKVALTTWGPLAILAALEFIINKLISARQEANKLRDTLKEIAEESGLEQMKSVRNFESLANVAVNATDGSKKQKDALDELKRTYKDIIPQERLTIENLRAMKGNYDDLTQSIRNYIEEQMKQKQIDAVVESYGTKIIKEQRRIRGHFSYIGVSDSQINRFFSEYERLARETSYNTEELFTTAWKNIGGKIEDINNLAFYKGKDSYLSSLTILLRKQADEIKNIEEQYQNLNTYVKDYQDLTKQIKDNAIDFGGNVEFDPDKTPFLYGQQDKNLNISKAIIPTLQKIMSDAGVVWQDGWANIVETIDRTKPQIISSIDFKSIERYLNQNIDKLTNEQRMAVRDLQDIYEDIAPTNAVVQSVNNKFFELANSMNLIDKVRVNMMGATDDLESYRKKINDTAKEYTQQVKNLNRVLALTPKISEQYNVIAEQLDMAEKREKFYRLMAEYLGLETKGSTQSDQRLGILQEMVSTLKQVNKEYDELAKKEGATKALKDTTRIYQQTFDNIKALSKQYEFELPDFGVPTDTASLTKYLEAIKSAMAKLPKSDKAVLALQVDIEKLKTDELQKRIEQKLKDLSDKISRTKTAKEFYDRILSTTGDYDLAANVTMSIYGDTGAQLQQQMAEQIRTMFSGFDVEVPVTVIADDDNIDYLALEKFVKSMQKEIGGVDSNTYKELLRIAQEGQRNLTKTYEGYLKDLEKAKTYSDKRIELARYTANKIAEIEASGYSAAEKERLTAGYKEREDKEAAKLEYEAFKNSALYVQMFEDLDRASTSALKRMRDRLRDLKSEWQNLDPTQLKELQARLKEIDKQIATRNPFKELGKAYKEWIDLRKSGRSRKTDELKADKAEDARKAAEAKMIADERAYQAAVRQAGAESDAAKEAKKVAENSKKIYDSAEKTANELATMANEWKGINDTMSNSVNKISEYQSQVNEALGSVRKVLEAFGTSDEDMQLFDDILGAFNDITTAGTDAVTAVTAAMSGDYVTAVTKGISAITGFITGVTNLFYAGIIRKANREIKAQEVLLKRLEYTYERLEKAEEKAFGAEYIKLYNKQLMLLEAQVSAVSKQLEAERSKGKRADEEKIDEYKEKIRDLKDEIADMQGAIMEKMTGTDVTSAARDFAEAWLDAYLSFGNTTDAIKDKFKDMIKSMIVNSILANTVKMILQPLFDEAEEMYKNGASLTEVLSFMFTQADQKAVELNDSLMVNAKLIEALGFDLKSLRESSNLTGIAKNVASASSEEINANTAALNTQNFYMSQIHASASQINANVAVIAGILQMKSGVTGDGMSLSDLVTMQNQHLSQLPAIAANTAATAERCERAARACEDISSQLKRVITPTGTKSGFSVNTTMS